MVTGREIGVRRGREVETGKRERDVEAGRRRRAGRGGRGGT